MAPLAGGRLRSARSRVAVTSVTRPRFGRLRGIGLPPRPVRFGVLGIVIAAALGIAGAFAFDRAYDGRVLPGISVAGVDAAGLTADELRARLAAVEIGPSAIEVTTAGRRVTVDVEELGRRLDLDGAIAAALTAGRAAGPLSDLPERIGILSQGREIGITATVDRAALAAWVADRADAIRLAPRSAVIVPTVGGWVATTPRDGRGLDEAAAVAALEAAILGSGTGLAQIELPVTTITPDVDELDATLSIAAAERMIAPLGLTFRDGLSWSLAPETLRSAVTFVGGGERPTPVVDPTMLEAALAAPAKDVARGASETLILKTRSGSTFGFVPGRNGRSLDVAATAKAIAAQLGARQAGTVGPGATVPIVLGITPPELTADEAGKVAREMTLVGSWTTKFSPSERNANGANITLPARFINGTVVKAGATFDFWGAVGPVTFARGFGMGGIIENGRTNPTGALAGGICSASTTLFNAAARAGYQILERDQHSYYIPRYPLGLDATVSKYGGQISQNMRFRNDTKNDLLIRGLSGAGWVRFEIYSLPTGRTVTFSSPSVSNVRKAIDTTVTTTALKKGQSERTESPANGMDVVVVRTVKDASGRVIRSDRFVSHYIRVDGVVRVGIG